MKKRFINYPIVFVFVFVAFTICNLGCNQTNTNTNSTPQVQAKPKYQSNEGKFKVAFLGNPSEKKTNVTTYYGNVPQHQYVNEINNKLAYIVSTSDYDDAAIQKNGAERIIENAMNGFVKTLKLTIDKNDALTGEYPGNVFRAKSESIYLILKQVVVGNRLYQIGSISKGAYPDEKEVTNFVNSFEIIK
jgi:hypothetical protein